MTAKGHQLSLGIGITYLLSKFHDDWWKTVLALIISSFNLLRASIYPQCIGRDIYREVWGIAYAFSSHVLHPTIRLSSLKIFEYPETWHLLKHFGTFRNHLESPVTSLILLEFLKSK